MVSSALNLSPRAERLSTQGLSGQTDYRSALFEHNAAGILIVDQNRVIYDVNPSLCAMLMFRAEDLLGQSVALIHFSQETYDRFQGKFQEALKSNHSVHTEYQFRRQDGTTLWAKILGARINLSNGAPGVLWSMVDTSDLHDAQEKLGYQALHDALTGLPNRRSMDLAINQMMAQATRDEHSLALMLMDLDNFKPVNDTWGHEIGDEVLIRIAERLKAVLRRSDFVARMGGDEFVFLVNQVHEVCELALIFSKIETAVSAPIVLSNGQIVRVGLSAGVALFPQHNSDNPDILLRLADQALYASKEYKQQRTCFWAMHGSPVTVQLNAAQKALGAEGLVVCYQPIVEVATGQTHAVEALARLQSSDGRLLMPEQFLPQLNTQDLFELTRQVLAQALADLSRLDRAGIEMDVSINLHPRIIKDAYIPALQQQIANSPIAPTRLTFEILEGGSFDEQQHALAHLIALRAQGVQLALDDLGSAYSSLQRMRDLPVNKIKLDQSFVRNLARQPNEINFVRSIQKLAFSTGLTLIVEGVETAELLDVLSVMRVPFIQGFAVGKPMPLDELILFLNSAQRRLNTHEPTTLLGVYAALFSHHELVHKVIRRNPHLINTAALCTGDACPIHHALIHMNITDADHPIHRAHHALHQAFHLALEDRAEARAIDKARIVLENAILTELDLPHRA